MKDSHLLLIAGVGALWYMNSQNAKTKDEADKTKKAVGALAAQQALMVMAPPQQMMRSMPQMVMAQASDMRQPATCNPPVYRDGMDYDMYLQDVTKYNASAYLTPGCEKIRPVPRPSTAVDIMKSGDYISKADKSDCSCNNQPQPQDLSTSCGIFGGWCNNKIQSEFGPSRNKRSFK